MIAPQKVIDDVLTAATVDETIVIVTDRAEASLRWANNSMTTNGVSSNRSTSVVSIVRRGDKAFVGSVKTSEVDPTVIRDVVAASEDAARDAPAARDSAPLIADSGEPGDWDAAVPATGAEVFGAWRLRCRGVRRAGHVVRLRPPRDGDDVSGQLGGCAPAIHAANRFRRDQRQTGWRQRVGRCEYARLRRRADRPPAG